MQEILAVTCPNLFVSRKEETSREKKGVEKRGQPRSREGGSEGTPG